MFTCMNFYYQNVFGVEQTQKIAGGGVATAMNFMFMLQQ